MLDRYLAVKGSREPPFIDPTSKYDRRVPLELPFQWEEKPRDRERKLPSVVKLDTGETPMDIDDDSSETEERDKGRDGVTSKNQPKVFIKAKKSQWLGNDFAEMRQDSSSYSMGVTTYEQQAKKEPDFIGNAFYYNLTKTTLFPDLAGEYIILYTRPVGAVFDGHAQSTIVSPSTENRITIATEPPAGRSSIGRIFQHAFQEGYWAAGTFVFEGMHCVLRCERLPENVARSNRNSAHVKTELTRLEPATDNMVFGGRRPRDAGASISFGMKVMSEGWCESRERHVFYGFHFLKMEIPIHSPSFGMAERQLIVAAKIPREGDIASTFILKQELLNIRDIRILQSDLRARSMADWHTYALTERFYDPIPSHGWTPRFPANLGMQDNYFNAARFEQHLQSVDNPILELCNLTAWISRFTPGRPVGHVQRSIHDARYYMENRYCSMLGELRLRQAAGFRHESLPTVFEELTDDDEEDYEDAMIGISKRGHTSDIETVTPLRRVINRGVGRGGKVPSTSVSKMGRERHDEFQF